MKKSISPSFRRTGMVAATISCSLLMLLTPSSAVAQSSRAADPLLAPAPPGEPTLHTLNTKTTTRLWGTDSYAEAVAITQHLWPAARPADPANGNNDVVPDRPWGIVLVTADDPLKAISAVPLIHFPDDAPILYVTKTGIPQVTLDEIKRLGPVGISRDNNVNVIVVGDAANPGVLRTLDSLKLKHDEITAPDIFQLTDKIDRYYGHVENPDTGVPAMGPTGMMVVMIGSTDAWQFALPATHWVSHMETGLFWVTKNSLPAATITALKRRNGMARIYVFGSAAEVSPEVVRQLAQYGTVTRISNDDNVAYDTPPKDDPVATCIAFAKMWDPMGMVGWSITGPGHGFTLVNQNDWQGAVASAPLSHLGFHAPLLLTSDASTLPQPVEGYFTMVAPTFLNTPAQGPYNMTYVIGSFDQISWLEQTRVDYISEMANRRFWLQNTGSMYGVAVP